MEFTGRTTVILRMVRLTAGISTALALMQVPSISHAQAGKVWNWGYNFDGELGDGNNNGVRTPTLSTAKGVTVQVAAGWWHTLYLLKNGTVTASGWNAAGELGDGTLTQRETRVPVLGVSHAVQLSGGLSFSMALLADGTVVGWGYNQDGELGIGTNVNTSVPAPVPNLKGVAQISAGRGHCLALKADGTVLAWGLNDQGQLGDNTFVNRNTPAPVPGLSGVVMVSAGGAHSAALLADGTLKLWGDNENGQLGNGGTAISKVPITVNNLGGPVKYVALGHKHTVALLNNSAVFVWGNNDHGQIGDGTKTDRLTPFLIQGVLGRSAAAGLQHVLILQTDGTIKAWGRNTETETGNGGTDDILSPIAVVGPANQTQIAAGALHSLSLQSPLLSVKLKVSNVSVEFGGAITLKAMAQDELGAMVGNLEVPFTIDGVAEGTGHTGPNGVALFSVNLPTRFKVGAHLIAASDAGNVNHLPASGGASLIVAAARTTLKLGSVSAMPGQSRSLVATLKRRSDGVLPEHATVSFFLDGAKLGDAFTDGTGLASFGIAFDEGTLALGSHVTKASFAGDAEMLASDANSTLTLNQAPTRTAPGNAHGKVKSDCNAKSESHPADGQGNFEQGAC